MSALFSGSCACGKVRFHITALPRRVGLCHCMTCRKSHSATSNPFAVFLPADVVIQGALTDWESSPGYVRRFCSTCGSHVIAINHDEVELSLGSLDRAGELTPQYESWVVRREPWLAPLAVPQHEANAPGS